MHRLKWPPPPKIWGSVIKTRFGGVAALVVFWVQIMFEVITLRSGRLFQKFFMIRKAGKVMQVTGPMVRRGSRFGMPLFLVGSKGGVRWALWFGGF